MAHPNANTASLGLSFEAGVLEALSQSVIASEERTRLALEAGGMGTWGWDAIHDITTFSVEAESLHGMSPGTFDGTTASFRGTIHPDDWPAYCDSTLAAIAERRQMRITYRSVWQDHSVHWLEGKGRGLYAADGTIVRMNGTVMDITERKQAEAALFASEARTRLALEAASLGTWDYD